jgi:branched-chain amino acid transport system ATP-binding protein
MVAATPQVCLELSHISKAFGRHRVLDDVSLTIGEREIVGIVGPNGAGKTTLFNIIAGLVKPTDGSVRYHGQDITRWRPHRLCRAGIGRTFQVARCFPYMTTLENVLVALWFGKTTALPDPQYHREAIDLLELVGLAHKARTSARELTLSELRRLEVARSLGTRPQLLLLDEIAAGLSPQAITQSVNLLESLR